MTEDKKYNKDFDAILIDTSVFDSYNLQLEKGLLGKLTQFKNSHINFLLPDVIFNEILTHLTDKINLSKQLLHKSLNEVKEHLFFNGSILNTANEELINDDKINQLARSRLQNFVTNTGAITFTCCDFVNLSQILERYFSAKPPFCQSGKKKKEFPDAIILEATHNWAVSNSKTVLVVSKDLGWKPYCENTDNLFFFDNISNALDLFQQENAPYIFLEKFEKLLVHDKDNPLMQSITGEIHRVFDDFFPNIEAESQYYFEEEDIITEINNIDLDTTNLKIIDSDIDHITLEMHSNITIIAEATFILSTYDSIDKDYVSISRISRSITKDIISNLYITISGDFNDDISYLSVDKIEIEDIPTSLNFGELEPDYDDSHY